MQEIQEFTPPHRRTWKKTIRIARGWFYITFSNCQVKKRNGCDYRHNLWDVKCNLYKKCEGVCPQCGEHIDINQMEIHHILPWSRFPELQGAKRNMMLLCHHCHKEVHLNPWLNIQLMQAKAQELQINLNERYEYARKE